MSYNNKTKKILRNTVTDVVNGNTGEIVRTELVREFSVSAEPAFVKLYVGNIGLLSGVTNAGNQILGELLKLTGYGGELVLNSAVKRRICNNLCVAIGTLDNALATFKKKDILRSPDRGIFMFNPELFGRGPWNDVRKNIQSYKNIKSHTNLGSKNLDPDSHNPSIIMKEEGSGNIEKSEIEELIDSMSEEYNSDLLF